MKKILLIISLFLLPAVLSAQTLNVVEKNGYDEVTYKVKRGDNLNEIADMYGTSAAELQRLNPRIRDINRIYPGQIIRFVDRNQIERKKRLEAEAKAEQEKNARLNAEKKLEEERQARRNAEEQMEQQRRTAEAEKIADEKRRLEEERQRLAAERNRKPEQIIIKQEPAKTTEKYPMYAAARGFIKVPGDIDTMEVATLGYGGGFDFNMQISKWFAIMPSLDAGYLAGNSKDISAESINFAVKTYFLVQPNVDLDKQGFQPYLGIGPAYTLSVQDVYVDKNNNCNHYKHNLGISTIAGFNYIYKNFLFGLNFEYNYTLPISTDEQPIHLDMTSGFTAGIRLGGRF